MSLRWFAGTDSAINHITLFFFRHSGKLMPIFEIIKVTIGNCFTGFNLNRHAIFAVHQQAANLFTAAVLPKIRRMIFAAIENLLDKLVDDQILKESALYVMQVDLVLVVDAEQRIGDACIVKIEFGRFNQPLVEIPLKGLQPIQEIGTLQNREPGFCRVRTNSGIVRQPRIIE